MEMQCADPEELSLAISSIKAKLPKDEDAEARLKHVCRSEFSKRLSTYCSD